MVYRGSVLLSLLFLGLALCCSGALASTCVECHTDAAKLKAIAKTLPEKVASAETAGKG